MVILLFAAFYRPHWFDFSGQKGQECAQNNFKIRFYFQSLRKRIDLLMKVCLPCQTNEVSRMDMNTAPLLERAETAEWFNLNISMDRKGPIHPALKGNSYIFANCDAFCCH